MLYDKTYFLGLLTSALRVLLASGGTYFVSKGVGTEGQWNFLVAGIALFAVNGVSILWSRYKTRLHFLAALNSSPGTDQGIVRKEAAERANI